MPKKSSDDKLREDVLRCCELISKGSSVQAASITIGRGKNWLASKITRARNTGSRGWIWRYVEEAEENYRQQQESEA